MTRQLFELPELTNKPQVSKRKAGKPDTSVFKGRQGDVFEGIMEQLEGDSGSLIVLEGWAGTGKTFTFSRILEQYLHLHPTHKVAFASTTNRSLEVSFKSTEFTHPGLTFKTIHSLLALKEKLMPDGSIDFYPDKFITPSITEYQVVGIDECSQFSRKLWGFLSQFLDRNIKIIMMGDSAQTPAINDGNESLVFTKAFQRENNAIAFKLTEIMRQAADNPIISVATYIRERQQQRLHLGHHYEYQNLLWQGDKGVQLLDKSSRKDEAYLNALLTHMYTSDNFKADSNFSKCVAWRRKTVAGLNKDIRRIIYGKGKLRRIEPNEKIISSAPIWDLDENLILISNGKQMEVIDFERQSESINDGQYTLHYYDTKVKFQDMYGREMFRRINIPTDLGMMVYEEVCEALADSAKSYRQGTFQFKNAWADFYRFQKSFAQISTDYAGTIHTLQGSTCDNVVVFDFDIQANPKTIEAGKILYTGITRAADRVFIL
jgi:exodeoxyribonuclease V